MCNFVPAMGYLILLVSGSMGKMTGDHHQLFHNVTIVDVWVTMPALVGLYLEPVVCVAVLVTDTRCAPGSDCQLNSPLGALFVKTSIWEKIAQIGILIIDKT
jgi:hypothetical protein